jgi:hypothetical protein
MSTAIPAFDTEHSSRCYVQKSIKGAAPRFSSEDKECLLSEILRSCRYQLRGYNNYSHQIAFDMKET